MGTYRGAVIYEIAEPDQKEGHILNNKLIAKALTGKNQNLQLDFVEEAATKEAAMKKIKDTIDKYLKTHHMNEFETDIR